MGNFFEDIGLMSTPSKTKSVSSLSGGAQDVNAQLAELFKNFLGGGLQSPFGGDLTAPFPDLFNQAFEQIAGRLGESTDIATKALTRQAQGIPAFAFDEGASTRRFQENFATPLLETYRRDVLPLVEEQFAGIPGGFVSRDRARGVTNELNRFVRQTIEPRLFETFQAGEERAFQSGEAAAARVPGAVGQLVGLPGQEFSTFAGAASVFQSAQQLPLTAALGEYRNLLASALGFSGTPTQDTAVFQGAQGNLGPMLLALAGVGLQPGGFLNPSAPPTP
ncbi:hypothetical protein LCGC14_0856100 [marine sediment metagenome]|uniref:Uncharacterized protein n=1 Tax=marine sediment metagenome TaxID=412755 RepID=A0A0F9P8Q1_9ZZZZ